MFKIDPEYFYKFDELTKMGLGSKSNIYRKIKSGKLKGGKLPNGEPVIQGIEILNFLKKNPIAS